MKKNLKITFCLIKQKNIYHRRKITRLHENEIKIKLAWVVKLSEININLYDFLNVDQRYLKLCDGDNNILLMKYDIVSATQLAFYEW